MLIQERVEFEGDPAAVWARLSDIERVPEFWHGTRSLELIADRREPGKRVVKARARFAFGGSGDVAISADEATRTLTSEYTSGPFKGTQVVRVLVDSIEARWEVNFTGLFKLTSSWTGGHFRSGTLHALERLCAKESPSQTVAQA